jgi:hypothetical protein
MVARLQEARWGVKKGRPFSVVNQILVMRGPAASPEKGRKNNRRNLLSALDIKDASDIRRGAARHS